MDNPNGKYFKIRRIIAIISATIILFISLFSEIIITYGILQYNFAEHILKYFFHLNIGIIIVCLIYLIVYSILVSIHDISFKKASKLGIDFVKAIKSK